MKFKTAPLEPDCIYHIYNRANGNEKIFLSDENYKFFLAQYAKYISPYADIFSYCLMPNHFHFLIRVKGLEELNSAFSINLPGFQNLEGFSPLLSKQFSNFFNSYAKAFNKQNRRRGSLFIKPFKRIQVTDEAYLKNLVCYIHQNPVEAGLADNPANWRFSSYNAFFSNRKTLIRRDEVLEAFNDLDNFVYCHKVFKGMMELE